MKAQLFAILVLLGALMTAPAAESADVKSLVQMISLPKAPQQCPSGVSAIDWKNKRDETWTNLRSAAHEQLVALGEAAVEPVFELTATGTEPSVRISALTILSEMESANAKSAISEHTDALIAMLDEKNPGINYLAAKILGQIGATRATPQLVKLAQNEEEILRLVCADSLGQIGDPKAADALLKLTNDEVKSIRLHAIRALGRLGIALIPQQRDLPKDILSELVVKLREGDKNEQNAAVTAVQEIAGYEITADGRWLIAHKPEQREPLIKELEEWWESAKDKRDFVIANDPEMTFRVNMMVDQKQAMPVRLTAIRQIARSSDKRAVDYLILVLTDADRQIRTASSAVASRLSGVRLEYVPSESEGVWMNKVNEFRRRWAEIRR